jgi:hypothetical protein
MYLRPLFLIFFSLFFSMATRAAEDNICGQIYVKDGKLKLNTNEKTLVCGSDKGSDAWKEIPFPQAEFHLKAIVLNLGYLNPRFDRTVDRLNVWLGGRSEFKSLQVVGATGVLDPSRKRKIIGEPLIPEILMRWRPGPILESEAKGMLVLN